MNTPHGTFIQTAPFFDTVGPVVFLYISGQQKKFLEDHPMNISTKFSPIDLVILEKKIEM